MALFKNGEVVFLMQSEHEKSKLADMVAEELTAGLMNIAHLKDRVRKEQYDAILHAKACGSKNPCGGN